MSTDVFHLEEIDKGLVLADMEEPVSIDLFSEAMHWLISFDIPKKC